MNHGFIITVHNYPELLKEIIDLLSCPNHFFFINIDKKIDDSPFKKILNNVPNVYFTEGKQRVKVNNGGFSQIQATINLLNIAHKQNLDYIHFISGQDYPCVSIKEFDDFFIKNEGISYMHYDSPEEIKEWTVSKYPQRYKQYHTIDFNLNKKNLLQNITLKLLNLCFKILPPRKNIHEIAGGWNWFSWHKSVTNYVLNYLKENPNYIKKWHFTSCCDEIIFHTLLNKHTDILHIERYNSLRYIEWHPKREYKTLPLILDEREYNDIINSKAFFCRKIQPDQSSKLIKMLKKHINNPQRN